MNDYNQYRAEIQRVDVSDDRYTTGGAPSDGGVPAVGLSMGHISPLGNVSFYLGGQSITVNRPKEHLVGRYGGGLRGNVKTFSVKSRRRLFQVMGRVNKSSLPIFVTLTYPAEYPCARASKDDLDRLWKRIKRRFPKASSIWKLEPQKRGAPHFHLLVWGVDYAYLLRWISLSWYQVVGSGDEKHLKAGTRVEKIRSWRGAISYASKYIGKVTEFDVDGWENPGRFWGILGRENIPWAEMVTASLTDRQACVFIRYLRRACNLHSRAYKSLTVNVNDANYWFDRLNFLASS